MPSIADRVKETTTTTGTGTVSLAGAVTGFRAFSDAFTTGTVVYYCITDGTNWEVGYGAVTTGTPWALARSTVLASSNAGALVSFAAGTKDVFCTMPAAGVALSGTLDASGIAGTATNDSASAGKIGEYVSASLAAGSATPLTTATAKTVTSISLTAGDWDVKGIIGFSVATSTTVTTVYTSISQTNNTLSGSDFDNTSLASASTLITGAATFRQPTPVTRVSLSATTTIYLVAYSTFATSTMSAFGAISARRVR